jgi:hypothetical protein
VGSQSVDQFLSENKKLWDTPIDEKLVPSKLTEIIMADTKIKTQEFFFPNDQSIKLNMAGVVRSMCEAATRYTSGTDQIVGEIQELARKNGVSADDFKIPTEFTGPQTLVNNYSFDAERDLISFSCYTNENLYPTVDKIVEHITSMSVSVSSLYVQDNKKVATRPAADTVTESMPTREIEPKKSLLRALGNLIKASD